MSNTLTATGQGMLLDWMFDTSSVTRPTTWFVALHVGANGGDGSTNELSGNGYARQSVTFSRSGNTVTNTAVLTFGPNTTTNWGTVTDITIWTASSGGTCLAQGTATASVTYSVGDSATIAIAAESISIT